MIDPLRLSRHLRESHRRGAQPARIGAFTCYLHAASAHEALNVAVPDDPPEGRRVEVEGAQKDADDERAALTALASYFRGKGRAPRVEFLAELHPELPALLVAEGWTQDLRAPLLACTPATRAPLTAPDGARLEPLLPTSPWSLVRDYLRVQREAYGLDMPIPERAPPGAWDALQIGAGLVALHEGAPVGAGGLTPPVDALCDVRGLGVVPSHRRRGIGAFLLGALVHVAHETGAEAVVAVPDSPEAMALARKAGFRPAATLVSFRAGAAAGE